MDFINIPSGGMRLFGDDINYLQNGAKFAISATQKRLADANGGWVILSGFTTAQVSGNTYSISGGWAILDNELCYFVGDTVTFSGAVDFSTVYFESHTYDFPFGGSRILANGMVYNPIKKTEVRLTTSPSGKTLAATNRYEYVLKALLDSISIQESNAITLAPNTTLQSGLPVKLYKKDKRVFLTANIVTNPVKDYNASVEILCTLPNGFRPDRIINIIVFNSAFTRSYLQIGNNGAVYFFNQEPSLWIAGSIVSVHNISFDAV